MASDLEIFQIIGEGLTKLVIYKSVGIIYSKVKIIRYFYSSDQIFRYFQYFNIIY